MSGALEFLLWPFLACLVLTGIHAYLGLHVVERGVIFVDLTLAQIAALGATVAFLAGFPLHSHAAYFFSLGFTLLGAALFSLTRLEKHRIPQEAWIGIVYAVSAAAAIILVDRAAEGAEHIKYILVGNLLAATSRDVLSMAALYAATGALHWACRRPLLLISTDLEQARSQGLRIGLWDFLFYGTFGVVVTSSVAIAGVLLVFSFLIVPTVMAMLFTRRIGPRLALGWTFGALASAAGMWVSYRADTPTGATVVCVFGILLLIAALFRPPLNRRRTQNASIGSK